MQELGLEFAQHGIEVLVVVRRSQKSPRPRRSKRPSSVLQLSSHKRSLHGSRTQLFTKFAAGYLFTRYLLSVAPVYRGGFPVYGSYVSIPEKRAVRLTSERVSLLDSNGELCLGQSSRTRSLKEGIENSLIEVRTTVKYQGTKDEKTFTGIKNTVPLNDVKDKTFTVTSRARYRIPVVENTQCRQVEKKVSGTMIQLYEHNPNAAGLISIDLKLIFASIMVIGVFNGF